MENTNLEALNALIEKIRAGEGTAESNLEALNMLCVLSGGTGKAKSNLEALNELLSVFEAAKPEQVKSVAITENGTTEITPDDGHVLSSVSVSVDVAGGPGIVTIPPVSLPLSSNENILARATDIDLGSIEWGQFSINNLSYLFSGLVNLKNIKWGALPTLLADTVLANSMFKDCHQIETINLTPLNITAISGVTGMFEECNYLNNILWGNIKIRSTSFNSMFLNCRSLISIDTSFLDPEYGSTGSMSNMFNNCTLLETLDLSSLKTSSITSIANAFFACDSLTNVVFEDNCFSNGRLTKLDLSYSPLSHDCAVDIFNKLATRDNSPTLKLSTTTKGYLTEDEIAIATAKGWVIG